MILSNILSSATSLSTEGSKRLPEIAKLLAPAIQAALNRLRSQDEFCLNCSTVLVAIGVLLEVFEIVHELREKIGPFKFHPPEMPKWMVLAGFAGWLMIVVGVAGEFVFEGAVSTRSEELESISNALLGDAQLSAAEAIKQAGDAVREAGELGVKVDKLPTFVAQKEGEINGDIAQFQRYANRTQKQSSDALDRLKADTDALNKASEDAKSSAKQAETELAAMQVANAPRYLLPQQQADFVRSMKGFGGLTAQILEFSSSTPDAGPLASLLESLLKQAGWKVETMQELGGWSKYVMVCVGKTPKPNVTAAAKAIVSAMRQANIQAWINVNLEPNIPVSGAGFQVQNPDMTIVVGSKL